MAAGIVLGQQKHADAESLLKEDYDGMKQRKEMIPTAGQPRLTEAPKRLVQFYEATGNASEAERWRQELAARKATEKEAKKG
jgi:hypothetical protein